MDRDIRTYFLFIALPALLITCAGLFLLVFGASGLTSEVRKSRYDRQFERYEQNLKSRMATRYRSYGKDGRSDYRWPKGEAPIGTNVTDRTRYGWFPNTNGAVVGWVRLDDGTVIGYNEKPFKYRDRRELYLLGIGAVMVILLFFVLFVGSGRLAWVARRAREDAEMKDSFLDMVSHELNTPLGSIVPLSSALAAGGIKDESRRREALDTVRQESARMARMIEELLTMVRLRNGKLSFSKERFDACEVVEAAVRLMRSRYPDCAILVTGDRSVAVRADRDKLEQVAVNLLENACKYAGDGPIEISCRRGKDGMAEIAVSDRGPGIPPELRSRIFERFYQCEDPGLATSHGIGLGLAIVSGLVRRMEGSVEVCGREGGGSVFAVSLPAGGDSATEGGCNG